MKYTFPVLMQILWIRINVWFLNITLNQINRDLGEGGVIDWSLLNFYWELKFGTLDGIKRNYALFDNFVSDRFNKLNNN